MTQRRPGPPVVAIAAACWFGCVGAVFAHDIDVQAERFLKSREGGKAAQAVAKRLHALAAKSLGRKTDRSRFQEALSAELRIVLSGYPNALAHVLRTWTSGPVRPGPEPHVRRCWICARLLNDVLKALGRPQVEADAAYQASARLTQAQARSALNKGDHKVFAGLGLELCDLDGDGVIDSERSAEPGAAFFTSYDIDLDSDGSLDLSAHFDPKSGWSLKAPSP